MGKRIPVTTFSVRDVVEFYTYVQWDDPTKGFGVHKATWNWYVAGKLVSTSHYTKNMTRTPVQWRSSRPAAALDVGHCKVEMLLDKKVIASEEFDVRR